ncbi:MAG: PBP1A family penicillin-binding protein [Candidatus Pacebacteria bacterium]|nr:PBP1A family penicillin-binding protein [Candidatus Paceibacterota bacterium]
MKRKRKIVKFLPILVILAAIASGLLLVRWFENLAIPDYSTFDQRKVAESTKIYDKTGKNVLYDIHENIKRTVVPYEDIPRNIKNATVAIEDSEFYQHKGISPIGILRALFVDIMSGELKQGGSTITQQLAKNSFLTGEKTFTRKIKELFIALKLEKTLSKDQILTLYLNEIPYGGSNYGIEAAANSFLGKSVKDLTLAEAAYLAALPQAPSYYSPYGVHVDDLEKRKDLVLQRMLNLNFIEEEEYEKAKTEKIAFLTAEEKGIQAPHFVMFVKSYLEEKYGKDIVEQGGLRVITTLDLDLQREAEKIVKKYAEENQVKFNAYNAGLTAVDPKTGQILVMVGSRDWNTDPLPENCTPGVNCKFEPSVNVTAYQKGRQPGSSFKPFVYATAFKKGYIDKTVVFDLFTEFSSLCNPNGTPKPGVKSEVCYHPENYDHVYRGPISLRDALAQSINVPAVKTLYLAGLKDSLATAKDLGINTLGDPSRYGLTLVLGGGEVKLLEMTGAYSVFANDGVKNSLTPILEIKDNEGDILEKFNSKPKRVLEEKIARMINDVLSDNNARTPAFGESSYLYFPERQVAAKTGTTNDYRDAWVIGYTPNFAAGVWVGNNDNSSMEKKVAGFIAAPMWNAFMKKALEQTTKEDFLKPERTGEGELKPVLTGNWRGGIIYIVDKITGKLATNNTPEEMKEIKVLTQIHSILYWVDKNNPLGEKPSNPGEDPQFILWETPIRNWVEIQKIAEETENNIPKDYDDIHKQENAPEITILSPLENSSFSKNQTVNISVVDRSKFSLGQIDFYLNEKFLGSASSYPFGFSFNLNDSIFSSGTKTLKLVVYDKVKNKSEYNITLKFTD